jgi:hypothetical protein
VGQIGATTGVEGRIGGIGSVIANQQPVIRANTSAFAQSR